MGFYHALSSAFRRLLALSVLILAAALPLQAWAVDSDGDGVDDSIDAFPNNAEATTDTDHDGKPDNIIVTSPELLPSLVPFAVTSPYAATTDNAMLSQLVQVTAGTVKCTQSQVSITGVYGCYLTVNVYVPNGGGSITFTAASSYTGSVTANYSFADNGTSLDAVSGTNATNSFTHTQTFSLAPGMHALKWSRTASSACLRFCTGGVTLTLSALTAQNVKSTALTEDIDDDNDGVVDTADKFPLNAAASADADNDGLPDSWNSAYGCGLNATTCNGLTLDSNADADGDGVLNNTDNCKMQSNANQLDSDQDGIGNVCDPTPHAPQTITITQAAPLSAAYGTAFMVSATASSGLPVTIAVAGGCSLAGNWVTLISSTCTVMYSQNGDANYGAAPPLSSVTYPSDMQLDGAYKGGAVQEHAEKQ